MAASDLYAAAQQLLAASALALEDSEEKAPAYQAITQGLPVFDCPPALYVSVGGAAVGSTAPTAPALQELQRIPTTGQVNLIPFQVTIIRCLHAVLGADGQNTKLPDSDMVSLDAQACYSDLWALWTGLTWQHRENLLFQDASGRREFAIGPAVPVRTEGGAGGWVVQVRVQLPGYRNAP